MIVSVMALRRADVADAAVTVVEVVPMHEVARPVACSIELGEARGGELRAVLGRAEQRLGIGNM